jgi:hypothetical protein
MKTASIVVAHMLHAHEAGYVVYTRFYTCMLLQWPNIHSMEQQCIDSTQLLPHLLNDSWQEAAIDL